jgi:hypothetical protein
MLLMIVLAGLLQPTSLGVLVWFPLVLVGRWTRLDLPESMRFGWLDAFWLAAGAMTLLVIWRLTLADAWVQRSLWGAFGTATDAKQILKVWDWTWLWILPLLVIGIARAASWRTARTASMDPRIQTSNQIRTLKQTRTLILGAIIALVATILYWLISWSNWAPLWHRRYFIAVLPLFACLNGGAVGVVCGVTKTWLRADRQSLATCCTVATTGACATLLVAGLGLHQRTLPALVDYPVALAIRGENWRAAVQWLDDNSTAEDQIFLEPDLIEARLLKDLVSSSDSIPNRDAPFDRMADQLRTYLLYPVRGPYYLDRTVQLWVERRLRSTASERLSLQPSASTSREVILIRRPAAQTKRLCNQSGEVLAFGNLSIVINPPEPSQPDA